MPYITDIESGEWVEVSQEYMDQRETFRKMMHDWISKEEPVGQIFLTSTVADHSVGDSQAALWLELWKQ